MAKNPAAAALGALGGRARAKRMTKAARAESCRQAALARWKDHEKKPRTKKTKETK